MPAGDQLVSDSDSRHMSHRGFGQGFVGFRGIPAAAAGRLEGSMTLLQDVRLALRRMRRSPMFACSVAGTLAVGVAATTSIYSVVDGVLLKPLPFRDPGSLVRLGSDYAALGQKDMGLSYPELEEFARESGAFEALSGIWPITANITGGDRPERVEVLLASPNYFELLGAEPALGRTFNAGDEISGIATVAVISDGLWRRAFGGDSRAIGRTLRIDEDVYEIVGVMPASFRHPSLTLETDVEVWAASGWRSAPFPPPSRNARFIPSAVGRMPQGMPVTEARARLESLGAELTREHPDDYPPRLGWTPRLYPLAGDLVAGVRPALLMLMAGVGLVLLIAISNISNLLLVRAIEREREIAIQRALGAARGRIVTSLLVEGVVLAVVGGALGFLASLWSVDLLLRFVPDRLPRADEIRVDERAFLFAVLTSTAAGLLVGLAPALQSARAEVIARLKTAGRGTQGGTAARVRAVLVAAQVALAVVLLASAALLARSLWNLSTSDSGISTERLVTARVWLPQPNEPSSGPYFMHDKRVVLMKGIIDRLRAMPGVAHAGMATALPAIADTGTASIAIDGRPSDPRELAMATLVRATAGYFEAMRIPLLAGRLIDETDGPAAPRTVVVNDTLARTYFAGQTAVGKRFRFVGQRGQIPADAPWITIVGVVGDVKEDGLDLPVRPQVYGSLWQASTLSLIIVAQGETAPPPPAVIRRAVHEADPNLPLYAVRTGDELLARQLAQRTFTTYLVNAFALSALLLAAFGLHGVIAYGVKQRTHEIGIRVALGATSSRVVALVLGQAARLTIVGVLAGLAGVVVASRLMTTLLFNVGATDPFVLAAVVTLLGVVVGFGTLGAALRAARIEAAVALRQE
jgi:predicted permease